MADDVYEHAIIQMSFGDDSCLFTHIMVCSVTTLVLGYHTYVTLNKFIVCLLFLSTVYWKLTIETSQHIK